MQIKKTEVQAIRDQLKWWGLAKSTQLQRWLFFSFLNYKIPK